MDARFMAGFFLRGFIYGVVLLILWFLLYLLVGDWVLDIHSSMFEIARPDFEKMNYFGMFLLKLAVFMFFLIPYLAIRFTPKKS